MHRTVDRVGKRHLPDTHQGSGPSVTSLALGLTYRPTKTVAAKLEYQNVKSGSAIAPRADSIMLGAGFSF